MPASCVGRRVQGGRHHQHTQGSVQGESFAVRSRIRTIVVPTNNGKHLAGISWSVCLSDDILVTGKTTEEHLANLKAVLSQLETAGLRLKRNKCAFLLPSVEYLGHRISARGIQPTVDKVKPIQEAPKPQDVSQLRSFIGLVNYYSKFLPAEMCPVSLPPSTGCYRKTKGGLGARSSRSHLTRRSSS